jgi:2-keto-3-deoxy-L-rhamnonate aldolase RhmA
MADTLRARLHAGESILGTFVKTPSHVVLEVLGLAGLHCAVIDAEHAPIGLDALDTMLLGARAVGLPALVRVPGHEPGFINSCLDAGASGVLVPHVRSAEEAAAAVAACRYSGVRGFSPSSRAGFYGTRPAAEHRTVSDNTTNVWCQIEDEAALAALPSIAAVPGVDCLFIGPADLALSMGLAGPGDPRLWPAIEAVAKAGRDAGVPVGMFVGEMSQVATLRTLGMRAFLVGSDQSLLAAQARSLLTDFE